MSGIRPTSFFSSGSRRTENTTSVRRSNSSSTVTGINDETQSRRRETVTIASVEVNKIFDAFNSTSRQLKDQYQLLMDVKKSQDDFLLEMRQLREAQKLLNEKIDNLDWEQDDPDDNNRIPLEISSDVHLLHNSLEMEDQYTPQESLISPHNTSVRKELEQQLFQQEKGYPVKFVKRAVSRYYETKRKLYLQSLPENQEKVTIQKEENKLRSRRKRLFRARTKVAEGQDKEKLEALNYEYVSDEEDGAGISREKWVVKQPSWRSSTANSLMKRLQEKLETSRQENVRARMPRVPGSPSARSKPRLLVAWAIRTTQPEEGTERRDYRSQRERSASLTPRRGRESARNSPPQSPSTVRQDDLLHSPRSPNKRTRSPVYSESPSPIRRRPSHSRLPIEKSRVSRALLRESRSPSPVLACQATNQGSSTPIRSSPRRSLPSPIKTFNKKGININRKKGKGKKV